MSNQPAQLAAVLLAILVLGLALIAHGLGWGKLAVVGVGLVVSGAAVSLLGALIRNS